MSTPHSANGFDQARALVGERRLEDALRVLDGLIAAGDAGADALSLRAQCLLATGRAREAVPAFRRAIAAAPQSGFAHLGLAVAAAQSGDAATAEHAARTAMAEGHDQPDAHFVLARSLVDQHRYDEAEAASGTSSTWTRLMPAP